MYIKNIFSIFILVFLTISCEDKEDCKYQYETIPIKMKYLTFDLDIYIDTLFKFHLVDTSQFNSALIIFSNSPNPSVFENCEFSIRVTAPLNQIELPEKGIEFYRTHNSVRIVKLTPGGRMTAISDKTFYKSGLGVSLSYSVNKFNLKSLENECVPKLKLKNIVFDDKYKDWLKPDPWIKEPWFSIEGIDQNTILE